MGQSDIGPCTRDLYCFMCAQKGLKKLKALTAPRNCVWIWLLGIFLPLLSRNSNAGSGRDSSLNRAFPWEEAKPVALNSFKGKKLAMWFLLLFIYNRAFLRWKWILPKSHTQAFTLGNFFVLPIKFTPGKLRIYIESQFQQGSNNWWAHLPPYTGAFIKI